MKSNLSIIDADSLVYLIAYNYKDVRVRSSALNSLDDFIMGILESNYSKHYFGFFGKINGAKNFRYDIAKTKPYKGTRPEKEKWFTYWEPILKNHMEKVWKFTPVEYVEADDMCTLYATRFKGDPRFGKIVICSPDKDLKQAGGFWHYDYKKRESVYITEEEGDRNLYYQCVLGDGSDNIPGLIGCGKGAAEKFKNELALVDSKKYKEHTLNYFKTYLHETLPAKQQKSAEKAYLASYKVMHGIKRYNKKLKDAALMSFRAGGKMFTPKKDDYYKDVFEEMYSLVYMLRTEKELLPIWKDHKFIEPLEEKYMDWDEIDEKVELIQGDELIDEFDEDLDFLINDDFEDI